MFKRFVFQFIFQWSQFKWDKKYGFHYNWYTLTPIKIELEYEKITEGLEFEFILLAIGFRVRYNLPASDKIFAKWDKENKKLLKKKKTSSSRN